MKLEEIERLIAEATPGPWRVSQPAVGSMYVPYITTAGGALLASTTHYGRMHADADLIAAARTLLPRLVAVARAAKRLSVGYTMADDHEQACGCCSCELAATLAALEAP